MSAIRPDQGHLVPSDGTEFKLYLMAAPGAYPEFRAEYVPLTVPKRSKILSAIDGKSEEDRHDVLADVLAELIKTWSITYPADATDAGGESLAGKPVPISKAAVLSLKWPVLWSLERVVVYGSQASDIDPTWTKDESDALKQAKEKAEKEGRSVGAVLLEDAGKN